jgi:hypothetical protein
LEGPEKWGEKWGRKEEFEGVWGVKINIFFAPFFPQFRIGL